MNLHAPLLCDHLHILQGAMSQRPLSIQKPVIFGVNIFMYVNANTVLVHIFMWPMSQRPLSVEKLQIFGFGAAVNELKWLIGLIHSLLHRDRDRA